MLNRVQYSLFHPLMVAVALIGLGTAQANASIVLVGDVSLGDIDLAPPTASAGSSSKIAQHASPLKPVEQPEESLQLNLAMSESAPNGTTSSSASTTGTSGGGVLSIASTSYFQIDRETCSVQLAVRSILSLPATPIVELLRPPRCHLHPNNWV